MIFITLLPQTPIWPCTILSYEHQDSVFLWTESVACSVGHLWFVKPTQTLRQCKAPHQTAFNWLCYCRHGCVEVNPGTKLRLSLSLGGSWADLGCGSLNCQSNVIWNKECSGVFVSISIHVNSWRLSLYFEFLSEVGHLCFHLRPDGLCLFLIRSTIPFIGYCFIRLLTFYWSLLLEYRPSGCTIFVCLFIWSQAIT